MFSEIQWGKLEVNQKLNLTILQLQEKYSEPASAYTEASMVNLLEKEGIGRPSTYANSVSVVMDRNYVEKNNIEAIAKEVKTIILKSKQLKYTTQNQQWGGQKTRLLPTKMGNLVNVYIQEMPTKHCACYLTQRYTCFDVSAAISWRPSWIFQNPQ